MDYRKCHELQSKSHIVQELHIQASMSFLLVLYINRIWIAVVFMVECSVLNISTIKLHIWGENFLEIAIVAIQSLWIICNKIVVNRAYPLG